MSKKHPANNELSSATGAATMALCIVRTSPTFSVICLSETSISWTYKMYKHYTVSNGQTFKSLETDNPNRLGLQELHM